MPKPTRPPRRSTKAPATRRAQNHITEKSAGVVVFHRGERNEYLLIYSTYWEFPKGRVDANEREVDAALREVREETGLDVHLLEGFRHEVNYFYRQRNTGTLVKKQVVYFLGEAQTKHVTLSWEHHKAQWLTYDDALAQLRYPNARGLLAKAHEFLRKGED